MMTHFKVRVDFTVTPESAKKARSGAARWNRTNAPVGPRWIGSRPNTIRRVKLSRRRSRCTQTDGLWGLTCFWLLPHHRRLEFSTANFCSLVQQTRRNQFSERQAASSFKGSCDEEEFGMLQFLLLEPGFCSRCTFAEAKWSNWSFEG